MSAPQNQTLEVLKEKVLAIEERYPGYQRDLTQALFEVLNLESDRPNNVVQQISRRFAALGELLYQKQETEE